jgi:class 3 adenylate cyclase/tetratricopeptide (TPR) repeat protein
MWSAAMDVGEWLRGIGLGQYEAILREHEIDAEVLPELTEADLEKFGVPFGHRKRLIKAIAKMGNAAPEQPEAASPRPAADSAPPRAFRSDAERRPITVLFCDLVGSTSLAAKLDAEDWRNVVNAYLDEASAAVAGFGGHVLKRLGDGLMALFGYPQAQENDAERAVRAGLAIQRALADINASTAAQAAPELKARVGIDSGPVVVEASGEVFGDAPNIAARVQAAADPGSVLVTMNVRRQVAGLFVAEEQGARELKGVSEPVQLFRIVRASGGGRWGGARTLTPFVAREEELGTLARRWERARAGEGQLVLIVGEPGLGKSRLVEEFHSQLTETPHTWSEWSASQLLQNTPLHPVAEWGRQRFGVDAPADQRLADLENTLRLIGLDPVEHAPVLAPLVDIPLPAGRAANLPSEELRRRQLAAMTAWVLAGARSQPAVVAFEDLHWADPTSLDLLRALADRGAQAPLLLLATTRPEFRAPWSLRSHHSLISLSPLDRNGVARLVGEISVRHAFSKEVVEGVTERTGGVPLFVEEVTRLLLERGEQGGVQAIPPTLQQSLAARLDRLGPAREVAQIGAVLGRDFAYGLLRNVAELDESPLRASLDRLADADLLFVEGAPPQANYRFKHALIQDAAYDSLLKSRRQALHRRAAEVLRESGAEPEAIAHHFTQAGLNDPAIEWWGKAGDQALRRSAFQEAIAHLGKAIEMADKAVASSSARTPGEGATHIGRMKLQSDYSQAIMWSKGFASEETKAAFDRSAEFAANSDDFSDRFAALHGQWTLAVTRGELQTAREQASAFLREAEAQGRIMEAGVTHRGLALMSYFAGNFTDAQTHCEQALAACSPENDLNARERSGEDTGTVALCCLALTSWQLGEVERARELIDTANQRAANIGHNPSKATLLYWMSYLEILRGDPKAALRSAEALVAISQAHAMTHFSHMAELNIAWAHGRLTDPIVGRSQFQSVFKAHLDHGFRIGEGFYTGLLAELESETLGAERGLARLDEALLLANQVGYRCDLAFLHRLRGEILLKVDPGNPAPAEEAFRTATAIAKEQGARSPILLASLALAKLYQSTDRLLDAQVVLAPALEGFSPTPEMPEIAEAQTLLAVLAETEEVKAAEAQRRQRLHLQTAYGQAMMWSKGFAAEETKAAFARASELAANTGNFAARFAAAHSQWASAMVGGEQRRVRELASSFLKEAEGAGRLVEVGVACRGLAQAYYISGEFIEARTHCERALDVCDRERERETRERFTDDTGPIATSLLGMTMWQLGEVDRARQLINEANRHASGLGHAPSMAHPLNWKCRLEILRGDAAAALNAAETLEGVCREHGMPFWRVAAELDIGWARGRLHDAAAGAEDLRRALAAAADLGMMWDAWFYTVLLAELEAKTLGTDSALKRIDEALALAHQVDNRCDLAFPHLLRGELLLKRDPAAPAPAEEAFQTALAIAKEQGARSWGLRSALSLAKLYQSTGRPVEAHAVLEPAPEGFSPTPEMPEIAEAQTLLAAIKAGAHVRPE